MLTTKKINLGISIFSKVLRFFVIFYAASILAKCVWWVLSPARDSIFIEWADLDKQDKATSYINNRYPFGVIVVTKPKEAQKPRIVDQLKVTGIYLNTEKDSFAFLEYQGKSTIAKIGGDIAGSGAIVKEIRSDEIVVSIESQDVTISISAGATSATNISSSSKSGGTMFTNGQSSNNNQANNNNGSAGSSTNQQSSDDFRQRRKKLVDEFVNGNGSKGESSSSSSSNNSSDN